MTDMEKKVMIRLCAKIVAETDLYETDKEVQNLIDWVCLSEQIKENNNTIRNLTGEYKKIEPDCTPTTSQSSVSALSSRSASHTDYCVLCRVLSCAPTAPAWKFNAEDIVVCDKGRKWLSILPQNDWYCITAMMDEDEKVLLWYIDMIASQGIDVDGVPYFDDLYLDLVVYPDGTIIVDDMDELEEALSKKDITQEQFNLAIETSHRFSYFQITFFIQLIICHSYLIYFFERYICCVSNISHSMFICNLLVHYC